MLGLDTYVGFQTIVDINAVKQAGVEFAYTKATDGTRLAPNGRADTHVNLYRSVGIPCGLYHYAQPGDPVAQANVFADEILRLNAVQMPPALDMEESGIASKRDWSIAFHDQVAARIGGNIAQAWYGSASWAATISPDTFPRFVVTWIAAYGINDGGRYPNSIAQAGFSGRVNIHQYTSSGSCPGIQSSGLDENYAPISPALTTTTTEEGFLMALNDSEQREVLGFVRSIPAWKLDRGVERILRMSKGVDGQNFDGEQYAEAQAQHAAFVALVDAKVSALADQITALAGVVSALAAQGGTGTTGPVEYVATGGITLTPTNGV